MKFKVNIINAFSIGNSGGNPAGVVFEADNMSAALKQAIATEAGFAETAFVSASQIADYKLDFFTPTKQIAHCGHATIATFSYLKKLKEITADHSSKETIDGTRTILFKRGLAYMEQKAPSYLYPDDQLSAIVNSLRLNETDLAPGLKPVIVNTGNSFLIVPVKNASVLGSIDYDRRAVYDFCEQFNLIGFYVYTDDTVDSESVNHPDVTTRMFAPFYGIDEESGTGMAAGPLSAYLFDIAGRPQTRYRIGQGHFMQQPSPSLIEVELEIVNGNIKRVYAGGDAYVSGVKMITPGTNLPEAISNAKNV